MRLCHVLPLSSAASWLLSSLLLCCSWCGVCGALAAPLFLLPPLDGRFLVGWLRVVCFFFCLDTEDTALHKSSVVSPWLHWSHVFVTKDSSEAGGFSLPPPLPSHFIHVELVCFLMWLLLRLRIGEGPSPLCCFCLCSERGGRFPVEPWTRLHCSELYLALSS